MFTGGGGAGRRINVPMGIGVLATVLEAVVVVVVDAVSGVVQEEVEEAEEAEDWMFGGPMSSRSD